MTENAFEAIAGSQNSALLLLCDHASNALPPGAGTLGLEPSLSATHIAYDIGAAAVTRTLAAAYGAPALLGRWSRLLIDLNRGADDPTIVMKLSDGSIIPGNRNVDAAEVARRVAAYHAPYHAAIAAELDRIGSGAVIISLHSFTRAGRRRRALAGRRVIVIQLAPLMAGWPDRFRRGRQRALYRRWKATACTAAPCATCRMF